MTNAVLQVSGPFYKLNKVGHKMQPCHTPLPMTNGSVSPHSVYHCVSPMPLDLLDSKEDDGTEKLDVQRSPFLTEYST